MTHLYEEQQQQRKKTNSNTENKLSIDCQMRRHWGYMWRVGKMGERGQK